MSVYEYSYTSIEGKQKNLADEKGKVLLLVNTASECGFTPQYEGLEALYKKFESEGLEVIGFPCNQFGGQEPGSNDDVKEFCKIRYGVTFPLSQKIDVKGAGIHPLYKYLTEQCPFKGLGNDDLQATLQDKFGINFDDDSIKWNFTKFLVSKDGSVIERFEPPVTPAELESKIQELLK